jgi:hypothetical protein
VPGAIEVAQDTLSGSNVGRARGMVKSAQDPNCMRQVWPGVVDQVEEGAHNLHVRVHRLRDNSVDFIQGCYSEFNVGVKGEGPGEASCMPISSSRD